MPTTIQGSGTVLTQWHWPKSMDYCLAYLKEHLFSFFSLLDSSILNEAFCDQRATGTTKLQGLVVAGRVKGQLVQP